MVVEPFEEIAQALVVTRREGGGTVEEGGDVGSVDAIEAEVAQQLLAEVVEVEREELVGIEVDALATQ